MLILPATRRAYADADFATLDAMIRYDADYACLIFRRHAADYYAAYVFHADTPRLPPLMLRFFACCYITMLISRHAAIRY